MKKRLFVFVTLAFVIAFAGAASATDWRFDVGALY